MPVQNSPPAKNTRSRGTPAVLTPTARVPLDRPPSVHQLSANLDRGPPMEGAEPSRRGGMKYRRSRSFSGLLGGYPGMSEGVRARLGEAEDEEGEESVEGYEEPEVATALAGVPEASEAENLAHSNKPLVSQAEPKFLKMMEQMTQFVGKLTQEVAPRDNSKAPALNTLSMKAPDSFDTNFFPDRKKALYSTSFLTGRAGKWIEPYLSNISNEDPSYLLNNWKLFEAQLFTQFGNPNEVRKAEQELKNLRMKESGHVSLYIAEFRSLMSRIGDRGERAYINVYRRGFASRLLDQLASYAGNYDTLQELMDITLELDTRYHERQKEKGSHKEKKPPVTGSNSSRPPQNSSSKRPHHKKNKKGKPHSPLPNKDIRLIVLKRRGGSMKGYVLIVVGNTQLKNASRDLRTSLGHQEASLASREKPEWES
ncbi:hypothetical protein O181_119510 [Austropuccinia psidii MF-1]|uniref:Retrotransposon gag domain-containing protein n=1 Tax=Austropuccinia psidii MF-1 TaxID=1389203 RepID=A0A9Q3KE70_9BASI|nr:hypothetical protein [Austropuccinia psidii MF-1]